MMQMALFAPHAERNRILDEMSRHHDRYLTALRAFARDLARKHGRVTIDDVHLEIERRNFFMPHEVGIDPRVFGTVFRTPEFRAVDSQKTTRAQWAARVGVNRSFVTVYVLTEAA